MTSVDYFLKHYRDRIIKTPYSYGEYLEVASQDYTGNDLIGKSNCDRILEDFDFLTVVADKAYYRIVGITLDELGILNAEQLEQLEELLDGLNEHLIYDEADLSERQEELIERFIAEDAPDLLDSDDTERAEKYIATLGDAIRDFVFLESGAVWMKKDLIALYEKHCESTS